MKNEASRARKARLSAANRLIKHEHAEPHTPENKPAPPVKDIVRRMVKPMEVHVKVVTA